MEKIYDGIKVTRTGLNQFVTTTDGQDYVGDAGSTLNRLHGLGVEQDEAAHGLNELNNKTTAHFGVFRTFMYAE